MGRHQAMLGASTPIAHDGPLHLTLQNKQVSETLGSQEALELLQQARNNDCNNNNNYKKDTVSPSIRLWTILVSTAQIRDQLQALQAYRSTLLHSTTTLDNSIRKELIGSFRILIEWSLSNKTTMPLRRAIQSSLETLASLINEESHKMMTEAMLSIWNSESWNCPVGSMYEALSFGRTRSILLHDTLQIACAFACLSKYASILQATLESQSFLMIESVSEPFLPKSMGNDVVPTVDRTIEIASTLKLLMTPLLARMDAPLDSVTSELVILHHFLWTAINCSAMHSDGLSKVSVAFGLTSLAEWQGKPDIEALARQTLLHVSHAKHLPPLNVLATFQGIAATLPDEILVKQEILRHPLASTLLSYAEAETDPAARLSALRGLHTVLNRCLSILKSPNLPLPFTNYIPILVESTLKIVLECWENPPGKQVASAIPGLFKSLVPLLDSLPTQSGTSLNVLVKRILDQPPNRKGRYIALETLLPLVGPKVLMEAGDGELISSLICGIGDRGDNSSAIADLLGKLLSKLREEMDTDAGKNIDLSTILNKKRRRKTLGAKISNDGNTDALDNIEEISRLLPEWIHLWAPSIAKNLLDDSAVKRKQIASFCIPLMVTIVGGPTRRLDATFAFAALLDELMTQFETRDNDNSLHMEPISASYVTLDERYHWAKFEVVVRALMLKITSSTKVFALSISKHLPLEVVKKCLLHHSPTLRLVAFLSLETVIPAYNINAPAIENIRVEMSMWKTALPYTFKSSGKEYMLSLFQCLTGFLNRASFAEAESLVDQHEVILYGIVHFVGSFLIDGVFVRQACYPGTVADNESFGLSLLQCIIKFATQNEATVPPGNVPRRRLRDIEISTVNHILSTKLVSTEVFAQLVSLMHSMWDSTRSDAFLALVQLINCATNHSVPLPDFFSVEAMPCIHARALTLSSSPRQREADTGARLLAVIYSCTMSCQARDDFLQELVQLASNRVAQMEQGLHQLLWSVDGEDGSTADSGLDLPLAHGLIQSLRLITKSKRKGEKGVIQPNSVFSTIIQVCCHGIKLALSVVADVMDNETVDGLDDTLHRKYEHGVVPMNVNTGAIGANGIFSSINTSENKTEEKKRSVTQRVVIGSWLLTKEACATLSAVISECDCSCIVGGIEQAGTLLISLLTTLKHQGAAFAAHKSLQQIVAHCYQSQNAVIRQLPWQWAHRMLNEISSLEIVRDSTLRRSTGYGLGFLSLMRSEPAPSEVPRTLCPFILTRLVQLSLPPKDELDQQLARLNLNGESVITKCLFFVSLQHSTNSKGSTDDATYDARCRVHALNILRLVILDAPMAIDVKPFIGDAIISSILGYNDSSWMVRNSSTMVFSAALLRVVDADKNASKKDMTSGNAITAIEFFRSYPSLSWFLPSVLCAGVKEMEVHPNPIADSQSVSERMLHLAVFPVLLLISRLHPVNLSGVEAVLLTERFAEPISLCLMHRHHKVRVVAARAIANISTDFIGKRSTTSSLLYASTQILKSDTEASFNTQHGALLAIQKIVQSRRKRGMEFNGVVETLTRIIKDNNSYPLPCIAVAIETLGLINHRMSESLDLSMQLVGNLNSITKQGSLMGQVGATTLAVACAQLSGSCCSPLYWLGLPDERKKSLEYIAILLQSNDIDIRLTFAKAFKKSLCNSIDDCLSCTKISVVEKVTRLVDIAEVMSASLSIELDRSKPSERLGPHAPTVRRLSRCLLECLYALNATHETGYICMASDALWIAAQRILSTKGCIHIESVENEVSDNPVVGNVIELMGFALQTHTSLEYDLEKWGAFLVLIQSFNQPLGHWRIRHSIALAIHTSKAMKLSFVSGPTTVELIKLLQDSDVDVRFCASQAVFNAPCSGAQAASTNLFAIEKLFVAIKANKKRVDLVGQFLSSVVKDLQHFEVKSRQVVADMQLSDDTTSTSMQVLINIDPYRKIFEEEDPNSYEESLLRLHFIALVTTTSGGLESSNDTDLLFVQCKNAIKTMYDRYKDLRSIDVVHEITRSNALFPLIHGLLLTCASVLFNGIIDTLRLREDANALLELLEMDKRKSAVIHPRIIETLFLLVSAEKGSTGFADRMKSCCFLLPHCSMETTIE